VSNKLTEAYALAGSPVRLSGTAQSIHALLLHRFDDRPIVNGRPNKGYRKSYPSMEEIQTWCTGFSRQSVSNAIEELIAKGIIIRVEIGRPGQRANYVPIYALGLLGDYVNHALHKSKNYKGKKVTQSVKPDSTMSKQSLPNVSGQVDTISNTTIKSKNRNTDRFTEFFYLLDPYLRVLQPGPNLDALLDVLEAKGGTLKALADHLYRYNYSMADSVSAVMFKRLRTYIEALPDRKVAQVKDRLLQDQIEEMQRNQATPEQRDNHITEARKALGRDR
jgi:hypothetical protein